MIPINYSFGKQHGYGILKRQIVQGTAAAINVSAQVKVAKDTVRLTLASDPLATLWTVGMKAMLRTSGNANIFAYEITQLDHTSNYIYIRCKNPAEIVANTNIANVIQHGITPYDYVDDGIALKNNNNEIIGYKYDEDAYFVIRKTKKNEYIAFQIFNLDTVTGITNATVQYSLNGVDYLNFPVTKESGYVGPASATGLAETAGIIIDDEIECYLRLFVDSDGSDYYVLAR